MSLDSLLNVKYTRKISTMYLLYSSRELTKTQNDVIFKHVQIIKFKATNTNDMSLDSLLKSK